MGKSVNDLSAQLYATKLGVGDEKVDQDHNAAPYWERLMEAIATLGGEQLELRRREAQRLLRENGVTYNVYGDGQKITRPWRLDPVPLLISNAEWLLIEAGLKQRAELLDLVLKDIYGKQSLLKKGLLPRELVLAHNGFLHACVGAAPNLKRQLTIYSANLARGQNGRMLVLYDRSQAPSGLGYALENRIVMARVLPDIFRETQVHRLSGFLKELRKGLSDIAPHNKEDPRIVILTPGSLNETYFEHAYLASYLGFSLVQGDDLTVRDGRVWLKTLNGLQPIDVILRRVDDSFCDPLELRSTSRLGIAGLLEAVRRNNVAIANPLGSSVLENPGLLPFLPRLSRYFLNQELMLPSVATWWCGQRREREFVLQNFDRLIIKSTSRASGNPALFGGLLSTKEKELLRASIIAKPYHYAAQELVSFSMVPAFVDHRIESRFAIIRSFVVASGDDYQVMPGGLTRVARNQDDFIVSNQSGGVSKDTWVIADKPDKQVNLWSLPRRDAVLSAFTEPLTSRAADNLFWVGRHLERIKAATRLMRMILVKLLEDQARKDPLDSQCLNILLCAITQVTGTYPGFTLNNAAMLKEPQNELLALAKNTLRVGTLAVSIQNLSQVAYSIRDVWSQDIWRCVDDIQRRWQQRVVNNDCDLMQLQKQLDDLISHCVEFIGLTTESMTREAGWLMLDSGRRLERALILVALLRATLVQRHETALQYQLMEAVLIATDSLSIYRRRYRSIIQLPMVLELLLMDETHPRSLAYQLGQLYTHINVLPRERGNRQFTEEERLILRAYTDLRLLKVLEMVEADDDAGIYSELDSVLSAMTKQLWQLYEVLAQAYFSHSQVPLVMSPIQPEDEL